MGIAQRLALLASIVAAIFYYPVNMTMPHGMPVVLLKGACVGLLALHSILRGRGVDGALLAIVMAIGSAGDMVIERNMAAGAALFLAGNLVAAWLYLRNRGKDLAFVHKALAIVLIVALPVAAFVLPTDRTMAPATAIYALGLGAMAGAAWTSRFSRSMVGLGALLFVASDLLIFAWLGQMANSDLVMLLNWPLYYTGQLLICLGILRHLALPHRSAALGTPRAVSQ